MSLRILSEEQIKDHYDQEFAQLTPGQFFTLQYGFFHPTVHRIFFVKERRPDGKSVIVHELSNLGNRGAITTGQPLQESMYRYNPNDCINVIHTTFGPDSSPVPESQPDEEPVPETKKRKVDKGPGFHFDLSEFEEYLSGSEESDINIVD